MILTICKLPNMESYCGKKTSYQIYQVYSGLDGGVGGGAQESAWFQFQSRVKCQIGCFK